MTFDKVTALTVLTALLLVVSLPPVVVAATVILLLVGALVYAVWTDLTPLWRGEPEPAAEDAGKPPIGESP